MNISSLVVDARPEHLSGVCDALRAWSGVQIHARTPQGKLIVTVETLTDGQSTDTFERLRALEGVMSVALVYHQFEPEPQQEAPA